MDLDRRGILALAAAFAAAPAAAAESDASTQNPAAQNPPAGTLLDWDKYLDLLRPAGDLTRLMWKPDSVELKADLYRQFMMNASLGYFLSFQSDPEHPEFSPFMNSVFLLQPNPDDNYVIARIRGDRMYRVHGERGTVRLLIMTIGPKVMGIDEGSIAELWEHDLDSVGLVHDGKFDMLLSTEKPKDYTGDWLQLDPSAHCVWFRQRSYDWGNEADARIVIECLNPSELKPRMSPAETDRRLREMLGFAQRLSAFWLKYEQNLLAKQKPNEAHVFEFSNSLASHQVYWGGIFDIPPDHALVLETELPKQVRYWNIQMNDELFNQLEYVYRQSHLNGHQARLDSDSKFRAVMCAQDPGVPNWLDTLGHRMGTFIGRWFDSDTRPLPTVKLVAFADIRKHLPADTPHVTPAERAEQIRKRTQGI